jgi:hypothetical protein
MFRALICSSSGSTVYKTTPNISYSKPTQPSDSTKSAGPDNSSHITSISELADASNTNSIQLPYHARTEISTLQEAEPEPNPVGPAPTVQPSLRRYVAVSRAKY